MDPVNAPKPPALAYAEDVLGVHNVWDEAQGVVIDLNEELDGLDKAQDARRALDQQVEDLKMDILIEERGKHADHTQAAFDRHLKEVYHKHEGLRQLVQQRNMQAGVVTGHEIEITYLKSRVTILSARMTELGGYFQYLAVTKQAALAEQTTQPTPSGEHP